MSGVNISNLPMNLVNGVLQSCTVSISYGAPVETALEKYQREEIERLRAEIERQRARMAHLESLLEARYTAPVLSDRCSDWSRSTDNCSDYSAEDAVIAEFLAEAEANGKAKAEKAAAEAKVEEPVAVVAEVPVAAEVPVVAEVPVAKKIAVKKPKSPISTCKKLRAADAEYANVKICKEVYDMID